MNYVVLIGNLTRDPEMSYTANTQTAVTKFTIAVERPKRNGESQGADFIRITAFGKQAENANRYISKGRQVAVQGRIQTGSYKNREGQTVYTSDIIADNIEYLGGGQRGQTQEGETRSGNAVRQNSAPAKPARHQPQPTSGFGFDGFDDMPDSFEAAEDDIPF